MTFDSILLKCNSSTEELWGPTFSFNMVNGSRLTVTTIDPILVMADSLDSCLPVANPEAVPTFPKPHINGFIIPKNVKDGEIFRWPGEIERCTFPDGSKWGIALGYKLIIP